MTLRKANSCRQQKSTGMSSEKPENTQQVRGLLVDMPRWSFRGWIDSQVPLASYFVLDSRWWGEGRGRLMCAISAWLTAPGRRQGMYPYCSTLSIVLYQPFTRLSWTGNSSKSGTEVSIYVPSCHPGPLMYRAPLGGWAWIQDMWDDFSGWQLMRVDVLLNL